MYYVSTLVTIIGQKTTAFAYRKRTAWFSDRWPSRMKALSAMSSAADMALDSFVPSPFVEFVYVLRHTRAWEERRAVGNETWKRLARCAVRCVSDWRWAGNDGREGWVWAPPLLPPIGGRLRAMMAVLPATGRAL